MSEALRHVKLHLPLFREGKVREIYRVGDDLLMVATDRLSAFDVVLDEPIPHKGEVLTQLSRWWFERTEDIVVNHMISADADEISERYPLLAETRDLWAGRSMLVHRTEPFLVECVVRGYITGSAWKEYRKSGTLAGEPLPEGLEESQRLDPPIFSPATKAVEGHDENITFDQVCSILGRTVAHTLRDISLKLYERARDIAFDGGVILADTKFEFGWGPAPDIGERPLLLIDEVLTPDSSRFWDLEEWSPGGPQPSYDKQPIRDFLEAERRAGRWDGEPPLPPLSEEAIGATTERYREAYRRLTGRPLPDLAEAP